jgi:hypothetical protein
LDPRVQLADELAKFLAVAEAPQFLNNNLAAFAKYDFYVSRKSQEPSCVAHGGWFDRLKRRSANRRRKKMRLMTITKLFGIAVVLLSGTPAFAARGIHHNTPDFCREQNAGICRRFPSNVEIPGTISDSQARANAASKTWPGDMILG